ncbi:PTS fructose-like transporter subunit IIB [Psychromonas sp. KJ10-2]|uniref:PTS fructose-like transporter subunit IIB n=1 Tax=Psychromonas sp. KJ10-2 TaxID=3391822 RepID=UPI0039B43FBB
MKNIVMVTACPSGVANSIIAAGLLKKAVQTLNLEAVIECQSSVLPVDTLTEQQIADADAVLIVSNGAVDNSRFVGKKVYQGDISECTSDPKVWLETALTKLTVLDATQVTEVSLSKASEAGNEKHIVAITACPTGVAHTFMAAEALEAEAERQGYTIKVETRGSVGAKNQLTDQDISAADLVIIAADIEVSLDRFNGKRLYKTSTGLALKKTQQEIDKAFAEASIYQGTGKINSDPSEEKRALISTL